MIYGSEADPKTWTLYSEIGERCVVTLEVEYAVEAPPPNIVYLTKCFDSNLTGESNRDNLWRRGFAYVSLADLAIAGG